MMFWLFLVGGLSLPRKQLGVIANQNIMGLGVAAVHVAIVTP
jgi:hypothetical protein